MDIFRDKGTKQYSGLMTLIKELPYTETMVEVGSANGESALIFAQSEKIANVICVDNWEYNAEKCFDRLTANNPKIQKVKNGSLEEAREYADRSLDGVYIDANHKYLNCKNDIKAWLPKIKKGGWIAGHDYSMDFPGVMLAVAEELTGIRPNGQVEKHPMIFEDASWLMLEIRGN